MDILENSIVIGAHPDDELLWFTSVLPHAAKAIIVYKNYWAQPGLGDKRAAAIAEYPHDNIVFLALDEPGSYGMANWQAPKIDAYGLQFRTQQIKREAKRRSKLALMKVGLDLGATSSVPVRLAYEQSYADLKTLLRPHLSADQNVFTHNPWGEYGHEDHVLCHRVVSDLRDEIGFKLWMSNYCTPKSLRLARQYFVDRPEQPIRRNADKAYAQQISDLYQKHGCWSWPNEWAWFDDEYFLEAPRAPAAKTDGFGHLFPLNFFDIGE